VSSATSGARNEHQAARQQLSIGAETMQTVSVPNASSKSGDHSQSPGVTNSGSEPNSKEAAWEAQLARLAAYKAVHGDCNVRKGWAEDPRLGSWVIDQRKRKRQLDRGEHSHGMTVERAARLTALGLVWDPGRGTLGQFEVPVKVSPARSQPAGRSRRNAGGTQKMQIPLVGAEVEVLFTEPLDGFKRWAVGEVIQSDEAQVRNIPSWPRSWANFSLF
jgi:hypothetical protein